MMNEFSPNNSQQTWCLRIYQALRQPSETSSVTSKTYRRKTGNKYVASWKISLRIIYIVLSCMHYLPTSSAFFIGCSSSARHFKLTTLKNTRNDSSSSQYSRRPTTKARISNSKNKNWYQKRKDGIKVKTSNSKRPPQWEKEGDALHLTTTHQYQQIMNQTIPQTIEQARNLLKPYEIIAPTANNDVLSITSNEDNYDSDNGKPYLWGGLSVGPIWKQRLLQAGYIRPTPIQIEAFETILGLNMKHQPNRHIRKNFIIAAPTGSGKSLAFLLPFLTTMNIDNNKTNMKNNSKQTSSSSLGKIWIVTPSMELAYQIQRMILQLMGSAHDNSIIHVLHNIGLQNESLENDIDNFPFVTQIHTQNPVMIAGTPKLFIQLRKEIKQIMNLKREQQFSNHEGDYNNTILELSVTANKLRNNLQTVIIDEADRLLQTSSNVGNDFTSARSRTTTRPLTQELLQSLIKKSTFRPNQSSSSSSSQIQIVYASATVGRSLRQQLMNILGTSSMDKTATLITADVRTKKDLSKRKSSLLPTNLQHMYRLVITDDGDDDDNDNDTYLQTLCETMQQLKAGTSLIFPGPVGIERTVTYLEREGYKDVRGLSSLRDTTLTTSNSTDTINWTETPIYVIKERLSRGLDIPELSSVFILGVPSNSASYAHLAGRTARHDKSGTAVSIIHPKETMEMISIVETLGLTLSCLNKSH